MIKKNTFVSAALIVSTLGYFVDIYDLVLFSVLRIPSLNDLGFIGSEALDKGVFLLNMQMCGMLVGGILWGILGDKKGRLSVLFGSIFLYSIANIGNAFVHTIPTYAFWRFIAGIGLAGELGAGITLVSESLSKEKRGYGTTIVATIGISGAIFAGLVVTHFHWRTNFLIGGALGLALLMLRIGVLESSLFTNLKETSAKRGQFLKLFTNRQAFIKYMRCIFIGIPNWYVVGIPITFAPEFAQALGVQGAVVVSKAIVYCYIGLVLGDLVSGLSSQWLKSRKKAIFLFLTYITGSVSFLYFQYGITNTDYYTLCGFLGFGAGYWAVFMTLVAEQFGTNLRATVTTSAPNIVRASVIPITLLFRAFEPQVGIVYSASIVGVLCLSGAFVSTFFLEETYGKELDYLENENKRPSL